MQLRSRQRAEKAFVIAFCLLQLVISPVVVDFYPFSSMPMYSDSLRRLSLFTLVDERGRVVSSRDFQLQSNYLANRHARIGRRQPPTINSSTQILPDQVLVPHITELLRTFPCIRTLSVVQKIYGGLETEGRRTVGVVEEKNWEIANPAYACEEHE